MTAPPTPGHGARLYGAVLTLACGGAGAWLASLAHFPLPILTGPALATTLIALAGWRMEIPDRLRDAAFLLLGISIGSGVDADAAALLLGLPLALVVMALSLLASLLVGRWLLQRHFGFGAAAAVLATSPGHLSFVLGIGAQYRLDVPAIAVVQSLRLLALTLLTPLVLVVLGVEVGAAALLPQIGPLSPGAGLALTALGLAVGLVLMWLRVPAALLLGGMAVSTLGHATDLTPGTLPAAISVPCFVILGTLIGTRFAGVTLGQLRRAALAGVAVTLLSASLALAGAVIVAALSDIALAHAIVAFAPGGLETMIAMSAVLGANPGFVAACHVARLLILSVLVPVMFRHAAARGDA